MPIKAAGFVIFRYINLNIEYLLLKASYGSKHWTPPKGHVDPGESEWITALRETKEEAGLSEDDLETYKDITKTLYYNVNNKPKEVIYWLAKLKNPNTKITLSEEHTELKWLNLADAQKLSGRDDFNEMLKEFHCCAKQIVMQ